MKNKKQHIFVFTGASGVGKSACMKYLSENYNIDCIELSARPFLQNNGESYDVQMTDKIQNNIQFNNTVTLLETIIKNEREEFKKSICFSRSSLDIIAYAKSLNKGLDCIEQQINFVKRNKNEFIYLYIPIEFSMKDTNDIKRGTNEEVRNLTDKYIQKYIEELNIPIITIHGDMSNRKSILDNVMKKYNIPKFKNCGV